MRMWFLKKIKIKNILKCDLRAIFENKVIFFYQ